MEKTKDSGKFNQMAGEARTALNMWNNIGTLTGKSKFPNGTVCIICGEPMQSAEHLINKAHGGNHTKYNVIPVCHDHKKRGNPKNWRDGFTVDEVKRIETMTSCNDDTRMNPYVTENDEQFKELRQLINLTVLNWRKRNGYI